MTAELDVSSDPVRTCVGCRQRRPQSSLCRLTLGLDGGVHVDGPSRGRGAWLCRGGSGAPATVVGACRDLGLRNGGFARAWRSRPPSEVERFIRELPGVDVDRDTG